VTGSEDPGCHENVDVFGNEYHVLEVLPDENLEELGPADGTGNFDGTGAFVDLSQTFLLHSNPGAAQTIYLDFNGHVTSGTNWNTSFNGGADFYTPAYNFEGDESFSDNELLTIQAIWQRVAEDFLPFNVNVTTQDPGSAALIKSGSTDSAWGVRVVIGGDGSWYNSGYGGVAYVGSFNWNSDTPTFVFEDNLGNGGEKYTAEAISHEAGHTLGLSHDGGTGTSYYRGHGSGETGWAPILGTAYYQNLSQWSKGEYPGATNTQDDLAIITTQNGFGYRADDVGNTQSTAGTLSVSGGIVQDSGIIERNSDVDAFVFSTGSGTITIQGLVAERGANLDLMLELYDASGQLVVSANPQDQLGASFTVTVDAGVYYLYASGVGKGDPLNGGYSDYGSLGSYRLSGTIVESTQSLPSYLAISPAVVDRAEGNSGTTAYTFTVERSGATNTNASVDWVLTGIEADASDFANGIFPSGTVQFNAGETSKTITIHVAGDLAIESDERFLVSLVNPSNGAEISTGSAQGVIRNDDQPGVFVSQTSGLTTSESGGRASFTVVLTHPPLANVVISVASQDLTEGTVNVTQLVFTPTNWNFAQTVTVTGVDDSVRDGNVRYVINLGSVESSDPNYNGLAVSDVELTNQDNERGGGGGGGGGNTGGGPKKGASAGAVLVTNQNSPGRNPTASTVSRYSFDVSTEDGDSQGTESPRVLPETGASQNSNALDHVFANFGTILGELI
jgi:hypothetical protein